MAAGNGKFIYDESAIKSLDWKQHIRLRPGMYIGKLGDGSSQDDGIYVLLKEVIDNCIDEHVMGYGKSIDIKVTDEKVEVRDYGRGIPLGKVVDCVSKINTGGKYDTQAFQKSVGLNGIGTLFQNIFMFNHSATAKPLRLNLTVASWSKKLRKKLRVVETERWWSSNPTPRFSNITGLFPIFSPARSGIMLI